MNVIKLKVEGSLPGDLTFELLRPARGTIRFELKTKLTVDEVKTDPFHLNRLLPSNLTRELKQWVLDDPTPGLLTIIPAAESVDGIPWEYLPQLLQLPTVFVVRSLDQPEAFEPVRNATSLMAAGWSGRPMFRLPGIQEELAALNQLGTKADFKVNVWFEPSVMEFANAYEVFQPDILHLIPATILNDNAIPEMVLSVGGEIIRVPTDEFLSRLQKHFRPRLIVLNTCEGGNGSRGPSAIRMIAEHLHSMTLGWLGTINDRVALDFARFIYARIFDGETIVDALRSYHLIQPSKRNFEQATRDAKPGGSRWVNSTVPVIWTPSIALLNEPLRRINQEESMVPKGFGSSPMREVGPTMRGAQPSREAQPTISNEVSLPTLTVEFEPQKWLNPALLKNGQPAINRLVITSDQALRNVGISVCCDTGNGISTVRRTMSLQNGPQPVPIDTWQFPVLYELIGAAVPRRQINFTVSCTMAGELLAEETTSVLWMSRTEWLDQEETWRYIPAFVDPYTDGVLDVISQADNVLKTIDEAITSSFSAYQMNDSNYVSKQVEAVFKCLRDKPFELKYIAPPPIAVYKPGELLPSGQRIRTPDEVVERKRGTCQDLAILFASCLEQIQIYPLVILIFGHTFFGFWKDSEAHRAFWEQARNNVLRRPQDPGREWTITDIAEIRQLLDRNVISLVEATKVTDRNTKFSEAVQAGYDKLNPKINPFLRFDVAVDIQASRRAIQPL